MLSLLVSGAALVAVNVLSLCLADTFFRNRRTKNLAVITTEEWSGVKSLLAMIDPDKMAEAKSAGAFILFGMPDFGNRVNDVLVRFKTLPTPEEFQRVRSLAESAAIITEGLIPDSGLRATKVGDQTVVTGMPTRRG